MQIVDVVPLTKVNDSYTFFSRKLVLPGSLVMMPFGRRQARGFVLKVKGLNKLEIRKGLPYPLRGIKRVLVLKPQLHQLQIDLATWISDYYVEPLGLVLKAMIRKGVNKKVMMLRPIPGLRDALFNFDERLEKIILEDEHSEVFKSLSSPRFHARDVALKISQLTGAELIVKSHSPTLEAFKYLDLKASVKKISRKIIDMKGSGDVLSSELIKAIKRSKSTLLIINRLGSSTIVLCRDCGFVKKCSNCEVPMVYHQSHNVLLCHHCGLKNPPLSTCEVCKGLNLRYLGKGVEKVKSEVKKLGLKNVKVSTLKEKLPEVDLVGVVSLDNVLNLPDFRSSERVFRGLVKLNNLSKRLIIQTYHPKHYVFNLDKFYRNELKIRKLLEYPPYTSLIKLTYKNRNPYRAKSEAVRVASMLPPFLGPAPAFIPKERGFYRWNLVYKSTPNTKKILRDIKLPNGWVLDVDPTDLL